MLVPMLLPLLLLLLDVAVPVSSADVSFQVISYRTSRKIQNGQVMCALDAANKTMSSSSLQDCSLSCARDATCKSFNIKNSLTCDLYNYKPKIIAPDSTCNNYQVSSVLYVISYKFLIGLLFITFR